MVEHFGGCRIDIPSRAAISRGHAVRIGKTLRLAQDVTHSGLSANGIVPGTG